MWYVLCSVLLNDDTCARVICLEEEGGVCVEHRKAGGVSFD